MLIYLPKKPSPWRDGEGAIVFRYRPLGLKVREGVLTDLEGVLGALLLVLFSKVRVGCSTVLRSTGAGRCTDREGVVVVSVFRLLLNSLVRVWLDSAVRPLVIFTGRSPDSALNTRRGEEVFPTLGFTVPVLPWVLNTLLGALTAPD